MNARDNTPLRAQIADRLAAGEDTAAGIAQAIGKSDTPSVVVRELNAMRTDGQVECEQRGKKKELVYWLAVPLEVAASNVAAGSPDDRAPAIISESVLPAGMRQGTRAAQIYRVLPAFDEQPIDARAIATTTGCAKALIDGALWAMVKAGQCVRHTNGGPYGYTRLPPDGGDIDIQNAQPEVAKNTGSSASGSLSPSEGAAVQSKPAPVAAATPSAAPVAADVQPQTAEIPPQITPEIPPTEAEDDAMPPADASLLALANRELADRLARVAHVLRGSGLEGLKDLDDGADLQTAAAALTGAYQMALANLQARGEQFLEMQDALNKRDDELSKVRDLLLPHVYIVRAAHAPGAIDCAKLIAERIAVVSHSDSLRLDTIARASETLAEVVDGGDTDPDELDLLELADLVAQNLHDLRSQIEALQREAMRGATCLSGQDRYTAAGYLVRASKRKPRTLLDKDKARDAALSSIRAGAQRAEVFALVPVGHARRGAAWWPA